MNTKVWCLSYFEGVYHTRIIETFSNANARMVHTMGVRTIHHLVVIIGCNAHHYVLYILLEECINIIVHLCKGM